MYVGYIGFDSNPKEDTEHLSNHMLHHFTGLIAEEETYQKPTIPTMFIFD